MVLMTLPGASLIFITQRSGTTVLGWWMHISQPCSAQFANSVFCPLLCSHTYLFEKTLLVLHVTIQAPPSHNGLYGV